MSSLSKTDLKHDTADGPYINCLAKLPIAQQQLDGFVRQSAKAQAADPDILGALQANDMDPLTYLDYLAYIPMFIDVHTDIVANPLATSASAHTFNVANIPRSPPGR